MMDLLDGLNSAQRQAVSAGAGPVLVLAGPGSGKTGVLTRRVAYLIQHMGAHPRQILAVTFTNKAAAEMRQRIARFLEHGKDSLGGFQIGTFHSTCARILRMEYESTPYRKDFVIYDTDDQLSAVSQALSDLNVDAKKLTPRTVLGRISAAKNELITPERFVARDYADEVVARIYPRYQRLLVSSNAMDFDDLLLQMALLLQNNDFIRRKYQTRFEQVLVDEFQDTNAVQYELVKLWGAPQNNIFAVGDEDQSIYAFRGADYRNVLRFRQDFPSAQVILLEQNYRSTQVVLDVARAVIDRNTHRTPKALFTERQGGDLVTLYEAHDDEYEARYVVEQIEKLRLSQGYRYDDFAVMYRTNPQSRALESIMVKAGVPYRLVGGVGFYKRREVKDLLAYLRWVLNPDDRASFGRIANVPKRGLGDKSLENLHEWLYQADLNYSQAFDALRQGKASPLSSKTLKPLLALLGQLERWQATAQQGSLLALYDQIMGDTLYIGYLKDISETPDELAERLDNLAELRGLLKKADEGQVSLSEFLEETALVGDGDMREGDETPRVTLLTLHAAKGLEFPVVFLTGIEEGLLPHYRAFDEPDGVAEERRLFYVGITRAKHKLFMTYAFRRTIGGTRDKSAFLHDVPRHLLEGASLGVGREERDYRQMTTWHSPERFPLVRPERPDKPVSRVWDDLKRAKETPPPPPAPPKDATPPPPSNPSIRAKIVPFPANASGTANAPSARYRRGQRVNHALFGLGTVLESVMQDGDELVKVAFNDRRYGIKTLSASIANLQLVD